MRLCTVFTILTTLSFTILDSRAHLIAPCVPCASKAECERAPMELCVFGEARDACDRRVCAKGPDERCGGPMNVLGECGEGLMCHSDEHCHGCHVDTMICSKS